MVQPHSRIAATAADRQAQRRNLFVAATLQYGGISQPVRIRNLSTTGALIEAASLPMVGMSVLLQRGTQAVHATMRWCESDRGGLLFAEPIALPRWIPGAIDLPAEPTPVAEPVATVPDAPGAIRPARAGSDLNRRIAEEVAFVSRRIDAIGERLAGEVLIVGRHALSLQELDLSSQTLTALAMVIEADRPDDAVRTINLTELRRRLQRDSGL